MMARVIGRSIVLASVMIWIGACGSKEAPALPPAAPPEIGAAAPETPPPPPAPPLPPAPRPPALLVVKPADVEATLTTRRQTLVNAGRRVSPDEIGYYMDVQQARLQQVGGHWLSVIRKGHSVRLSLPGRWSFQVGSAELSSSAQSALSSIARVLADYRLSLITVHGHTDDAGDPAFNQTLSEKRALAVARHLVSDGVSLDRILVVGHGAANPLASNASEDGREENRRVELQIDPLTEKTPRRRVTPWATFATSCSARNSRASHWRGFVSIALGTFHRVGRRVDANHAPVVVAKRAFERAGAVMRFDEEHERRVGDHGMSGAPVTGRSDGVVLGVDARTGSVAVTTGRIPRDSRAEASRWPLHGW